MVRPSHEARGFLEAFFVEVVEKFLRLKMFTEKQRQTISLESGKRFAFYLSKKIDDELNEILACFQKFKSIEVLSADDEEHFFLQLQQCFLKDFENIHAGLRCLPTPWVGAEIYAFAEGIFRDNQKELRELYTELNGTLSFTDVYNFFHYEAFRHLPGITAEEKPVVWLLPKVEDGNPLEWSMISHEVAHDIVSHYNIDDVLRELLPNASNLVLRRAIELAVDLIAVRLLGPAYLLSFMNIAMFFVRENLRYCLPEHTHPSPYFRVEYMKEELNGKEINLDEVEIRYSPSDKPYLPAKTYLDLFSQRLSLDARVYHCDGGLLKKIQDEERALGEKVRQALSTVDAARGGLPLPQFNSQNCSRSLELAKRLRKKVLIGSFRKESQDDKIPVAIESKEQFRTILKKLNEEPSYVSEILNAGWFEKSFRLSHSLSLIKKIVEDGSGVPVNGYRGMDEQYIEYIEFVSDLDYMLQKSIEVSTVHLFFDRGFMELKLGEK